MTSSITEKLRELRDRGITVAAIAAHCGVSPRTVEGWLQGRHASASAMKLIATL
jgi:transcriptional regulator with XRE-family HTH domain